ncbi:hypothetical protein HpDR4_27520 [Helicobacter pylori]
MQAARTHGIEDSVIEEIIDIGQTLSLIYRHEDLIDASDLPREQKKAVHAELQKSIDENLEVLKKNHKHLKEKNMPLPFILGGLALVAAGYGVKKGIDALDADCEADEFIKKAENLKEEAKRKADRVQSSRNQALVRLGKKKLHVLSHTASNFLDHFHRLERLRITIGTKDTDMQHIQKQVLDVRNLLNQLNTNGIDGDSALGVIAGCGGLGASSFTAGAVLGGGLAASGLAGTAVLGGLVAGPALAILGAISADEMEKKRDDAKAYLSQVKVAVKKADAMIDNIQAVRKVVDLFTEQITKLDALFFSLSQGTIATMKKHHYDTSLYNQKEKDQLCVTVSTLMTLSAFLKVLIMDEHQKLNEKAQKALNLMRDQMDSLKNGNYSLDGIGFRQAWLKDLRDDKNS